MLGIVRGTDCNDDPLEKACISRAREKQVAGAAQAINCRQDLQWPAAAGELQPAKAREQESEYTIQNLQNNDSTVNASAEHKNQDTRGVQAIAVSSSQKRKNDGASELWEPVATSGGESGESVLMIGKEKRSKVGASEQSSDCRDVRQPTVVGSGGVKATKSMKSPDPALLKTCVTPERQDVVLLVKQVGGEVVEVADAYLRPVLGGLTMDRAHGHSTEGVKVVIVMKVRPGYDGYKLPLVDDDQTTTLGLAAFYAGTPIRWKEDCIMIPELLSKRIRGRKSSHASTKQKQKISREEFISNLTPKSFKAILCKVLCDDSRSLNPGLLKFVQRMERRCPGSFPEVRYTQRQFLIRALEVGLLKISEDLWDLRSIGEDMVLVDEDFHQQT